MNADGSGWLTDGIRCFLRGLRKCGRIAFVSDHDGDNEIYVMNADGGGVVQLTDDEYHNNFPAWALDGRISFASNRDGDGGVVEPCVVSGRWSYLVRF